jgi:MoaA/NifB/PqqE/SkfB family radical SAM enzyme
MAIKAAMVIGRTLVKEGISVFQVTATITGSNNARLTAIWKRISDKELNAQLRAKAKARR